MAVKLRMTRMGRRHRPFFRINAVEARTPRDGRILEKLGHYDPIEKDPAKQVVLNRERTEYWLDKAAIPSRTAALATTRDLAERSMIAPRDLLSDKPDVHPQSPRVVRVVSRNVAGALP